MTTVAEAAFRLKTICTRHGEHPAARGASDTEIERIKETFAALEFPLPTGLLEVYKVTLAIPGALNLDPVLGAPCIFNDPSFAYVTCLINQEDDTNKEGGLVVGTGK